MATTATNTRCCDCCGRPAGELDSRDHCAPCRLYFLSADEGARCVLIEAIRRMIEGAITYEGVNPQDIRQAVDEVLGAAERNWTNAGVEFDERVVELTAAIREQTASMPTGMVA